MFTLFANSQVLIKNTNIGPRELGQHRKESSLLAENEGVSRGLVMGPVMGRVGGAVGRTGRDGTASAGRPVLAEGRWFSAEKSRPQQ